MKLLQQQWDRVAAGLAALVGAVSLILGWVGVSDKVYPGEQIPYIVSGGLGGIFLLGLGAVLWITADLRDEWRKLDDLEHALERLAEQLDDSALTEVNSRNGKARSRRVPVG